MGLFSKSRSQKKRLSSQKDLIPAGTDAAEKGTVPQPPDLRATANDRLAESPLSPERRSGNVFTDGKSLSHRSLQLTLPTLPRREEPSLQLRSNDTAGGRHSAYKGKSSSRRRHNSIGSPRVAKPAVFLSQGDCSYKYPHSLTASQSVVNKAPQSRHRRSAVPQRKPPSAPRSRVISVHILSRDSASTRTDGVTSRSAPAEPSYHNIHIDISPYSTSSRCIRSRERADDLCRSYHCAHCTNSSSLCTAAWNTCRDCRDPRHSTTDLPVCSPATVCCCNPHLDLVPQGNNLAQHVGTCSLDHPSSCTPMMTTGNCTSCHVETKTEQRLCSNTETLLRGCPYPGDCSCWCTDVPIEAPAQPYLPISYPYDSYALPCVTTFCTLQCT